MITSHSCGKATAISLGRLASWLEWDLREPPGWMSCATQVDGDSDTMPACRLCGGNEKGGTGLNKGIMVSACTSVWKKAFPSSHPDVGYQLPSPCVSDVFESVTFMLELRGSESK